jgi:hypothetical protein
MIIVLHHQETDDCTYFISTQLFIEAESEEALFLDICSAVSVFKEQNSLSDADLKQHGCYLNINGTDVSTTDLVEDNLTLEPLDKFLANANTLKITNL